MAANDPFLQAAVDQKMDRIGPSSLNSLTHQNLCRRDAISGDWVIFAPGRNERPAEILERELAVETNHECPFCAGNEAHTPPATFSISEPSEASDWSVRVVPNLFPAVLAADLIRSQGNSSCSHPDSTATRQFPPEPSLPPISGERSPDSGETHDSSRHASHSLQPGSHNATGIPCGARTTNSALNALDEDDSHWGMPTNPLSSTLDPLFQSYDLHGGHEVIVETPAHVETLTSLSTKQVGRVFEAYAERIRYWSKSSGIQYVVVFKNVGAAAGASLRHTHSQLVATSLMPPAIRRNCRRSTDHYRRTNQCLMCNLIQGELTTVARMVAQTDHFIAFCPFASRLPYLVRIAPRGHADRFEMESTSKLHEVAGLVQQVIKSLESLFANCAYNYTVHTRPRGGAKAAHFHWWMEIFPRLTKVAGFEWGSDCFINPITPEMAAQQLRQH